MLTRCIVAAALVAAASALTAQAMQPNVRTGGVGDDERRALESDSRYNLKLVAANRAGEYIADVDVSVFDDRGTQVVSTRMAGPWLLAELPPGRYRVVASYGGTTQTRDILIGRDGRREVVIQWPDVPALR